MAVATFTLPFYGTPAFYSGSGQTSLVPSLYPVAIDGRPYMVDQKSGQFAREYEPRVRDSQDISTAPGEAAINPGGLWRRGQDSWHLGAGQQYADTAEAQDYRFYKSKGIDPWTKGQISLLNDTSKILNTASTNLQIVTAGGRLYVADGPNLKFTTDLVNWTTCDPPSTPWTDDIVALATDGNTVYLSYTTQTGVYQQSSTSSSPHAITSFLVGDNWYMLDYAKGFLLGSHSNSSGTHSSRSLHIVTSGSKTEIIEPSNTGFTWIDVAAGQNAIYVAAKTGAKSYVYKVTIKSDGTLDTPSVSLELPTGETIASLHGYLGFILIGTDKGVRFCSTDNGNNLVAGPLIPTSNSVLDFATDGKYAWYTYTNYDGVSGGLGRLDLSVFTGANTPAYATDLMYGSVSTPATSAVRACASFNSKRVFSISGVGVIAENTSSLVSSGTIELGTYRWGIPDRKFVAKVDVRSEPLTGSVTAYLTNDNAAATNLGTWSTVGDTENTFDGTETKTIETAFKLDLTRAATVTQGPVVTRWMTRAYVAPFRSQLFTVPVLLHSKLRLRNNREIALDVQDEQNILDKLISNPRIVVLQIGESVHSVIVEDIRWVPLDSHGNTWEWEGTAVVSMRSVEN